MMLHMAGKKSSAVSRPKLPSAADWRTTDADEIAKRQMRAREEKFRIVNRQPAHPVFSNFAVQCGSGLAYSVEIRDVRERRFACDCVDFRINGLGTCKHVEAVLLHVETRFRKQFRAARDEGSNRIDICVDPASDRLSARNGHVGAKIPRRLAKWFDAEGVLANGSPAEVLPELERLAQGEMPNLRVSQEIEPWLENARRAAERKRLRAEYEAKVQSGEWPPQETKVPLFPYQREGMLHLAFTDRALLADEMGLGKTIQAIAACALLHRLGNAQRVLVVTPASLKTEWEEQIQRFTELSYQLVFGSRHERLKRYGSAPFFTIVNYEQMVVDALEVNERLKPDIVVLDEAQRIKNWHTKTAQAIKRLRSRYAFVLTGTPIENRIDELHSLMDFLNPALLGPLFRFNRDFYELDDRGRPMGFRNLDQLHARIQPYMLRRRKEQVETELPERTDRNHFVPLSDNQRAPYEDHKAQVARLVFTAKRRPLTKQEQDKLQRELAMMRMVCDTNYILDQNDRECPKLAELEKLLEECRENDAKVIIFSEWERMLELVRELCREMNLGFAWHTGSVPQRRRRAEINAFKTDPDCRVFLSTDSGSTGLNLQNASIVINCDLPWNPAKLEQRIARAWRKNQTRPVTVFNLVSEDTIESKMLDTLAHKQALADGVLDLRGDLSEIRFRGGSAGFVAKLEQFISNAEQSGTLKAAPSLPSDRSLAFAQRARAEINGALVRCEERYPNEGAHTLLLVVVDRDPPFYREKLSSLHDNLFGPGRSDPLAPVQLEVIDRATDEALEKLIAAGVIARTIRTTRPLFPVSEAPVPLSKEEQAKAAAHRAEASHHMKIARLLAEGGFPKEARPRLIETALNLAKALCIEQRLTCPETIEEAFRPPCSHVWQDSFPVLWSFISDPEGDSKIAIERLGMLMNQQMCAPCVST